jgi:phosphoribosylformylglycinamidine synthase
VRFAVVVFPGSNCDADTYHALNDVTGETVDYIWHQSKDITGYDCVVLPGGFSYGDYLRAGAIARFSPVMQAVAAHAERGGLVLGICNGFQILCEAGLLPGALHRNASLRFRCHNVYIKVENEKTPFTNLAAPGQVLQIPIAHGEGNYFADLNTLHDLEENGQVVFRYCDAAGNVSPSANPNGSANNIAGICNKAGNVVGMMPHPERNADVLLGNADGQIVLRSIMTALALPV